MDLCRCTFIAAIAAHRVISLREGVRSERFSGENRAVHQ
jgi:hypothetical protein